MLLKLNAELFRTNKWKHVKQCKTVLQYLLALTMVRVTNSIGFKTKLDEVHGRQFYNL